MNNTATLRERLRDITGTFKASDFADVPNAHAIITKMVNSGEVIIVSNTRPKVYRVGKLKDHKAKPAPKAISAKRIEKINEVPLVVQLWSKVWPEYFRIPEFGGYKSMIRIHQE